MYIGRKLTNEIQGRSLIQGYNIFGSLDGRKHVSLVTNFFVKISFKQFKIIKFRRQYKIKQFKKKSTLHNKMKLILHVLHNILF